MKMHFAVHAVIILTMLVMLIASQPVFAQSTQPDPNLNLHTSRASADLASLLQPDGTLQVSPGLQASLSLEGWQMTLDASGQPHFSHPVASPETPSPDNRFWSHEFLLGSEDILNGGGTVYAMTVDQNMLYVGGDFTAVGSAPAQHIARWDINNRRWEALGTGVDSRVKAIAVANGAVYVGGNFSQAGGITTGPLARWDISTGVWSAIGVLGEDSISPEVDAIAASPTGVVYVGGTFNTVAGISANNIARLTGSTWDGLKGGVNYITAASTKVNAITMGSGSRVYVGGVFSTAGGYTANNLAIWDNADNGWHLVGGGIGGFNAAVQAIAWSSGDTVYVGGGFSEAYDGSSHTLPVHSIAQWNGSAWSDMGGGVDVDISSLVYRSSDGLYAAGRFTTAGGSPARRVARWNGAWSVLKDSRETLDGTDINIDAMAASSSYLFLGGSFEQAGDHSAHHLAGFRLNDHVWTGLGGSVNGAVNAMAISGGYVYVGGSFSDAGGTFRAYLARWSLATHQWYIVGDGNELNGCSGVFCVPAVFAIAVNGDDIYVGGNFTKIGTSLVVNGIARFHGINPNNGWTAMGSGVTCSPLPCAAIVRAISLWNTRIYIGGSFTTAGGVPANNVAAWNGSGWNGLIVSAVNGTNGQVYAISPMINGLAIGGSFTKPYPYIAEWTGAAWSVLGVNALNGTVYAILQGDVLHPLTIGGHFTSPLHIARLSSGNTWEALGSGFNTDVHALSDDSTGGFYAGGDFNASGGQTLLYIAHWSHDAWSPLGIGMNAGVQTLASNGDQLFAGGYFTNAGAYPSYFFASWNKTVLYLPVLHK